ncbi:MAG: c-type cytochrome, partial [Proteobacteria bacterium]
MGSIFQRMGYAGIGLVTLLELSSCQFISTASITQKMKAVKNTVANQEEIAESKSFTAFNKVMSSRCFACHEGSNNGNFHLTEAGWKLSGYIVAGSPENSKIYNYIRGADSEKGPKNMPKNGDLSQSEIAAVKNYILSLQETEIACSKPTVVERRANLLTAEELRYSVWDLIGRDPGEMTFLPFRPGDAYGFKNKPVDFKLDPVFLEALYDRAESIIETIEKSPGSYPALYSCSSGDYRSESCRLELVRKFAERAFRRALD